MWPFLGFLGEVAILACAIGIYEFRKRSSEKITVENNKEKNLINSDEAANSSELRRKSVNNDKKAL